MPHSDDDSSDSDDSVRETNENAEPTFDKEDKLVDTTQDESVSSNVYLSTSGQVWLLPAKSLLKYTTNESHLIVEPNCWDIQ